MENRGLGLVHYFLLALGLLIGFYTDYSLFKTLGVVNRFSVPVFLTGMAVKAPLLLTVLTGFFGGIVAGRLVELALIVDSLVFDFILGIMAGVAVGFVPVLTVPVMANYLYLARKREQTREV